MQYIGDGCVFSCRFHAVHAVLPILNPWKIYNANCDLPQLTSHIKISGDFY